MTVDRMKVSLQTVKDNIAIMESIEEPDDVGYYLQLEHEKFVAEVIEKQIPKKPEYSGDGYSDGELVYDYAKCPECGNDNFEYGINNWGCKFCPDCGQALDWSDNE